VGLADRVGASVVGAFVGLLVGGLDGASVGDSGFGATVGEFVGILVGGSVAGEPGFEPGFTTGRLVGRGVSGASVGLSVGDSVSFQLGHEVSFQYVSFHMVSLEGKIVSSNSRSTGSEGFKISSGSAPDNKSSRFCPVTSVLVANSIELNRASSNESIFTKESFILEHKKDRTNSYR